MEAPDKIYLTNGDSENLINFDSDAANGLVMWCEDKITDYDIEYIRKDLLLEILNEKLKELWNASSAQADKDEYYQNPLVKQLKELINKLNLL